MNIKEKSRKYWEIWQNYEEKDLVYRVSLLISAFLIGVLSLSLIFTANRKPLVISLKNGVASVTSYEKDSNEIEETEAKVFVQNFVKYYYNWTPETISKNLDLSLSFLDTKLRRESRDRMEEKVYEAKVKNLSQSLYVKNIDFNKKTSEVTLSSDRVFTVDKVKLTSEFKVIFRLTKKKRTQKSPSGLLISELRELFAQEK